MQGLDTHEPEKGSAQSQDEPVQESRQRMEGQEADTDSGGGAAWDNVTDILSLHSPLRKPRHGRTFVYKRLEKFLQSGPRTGDFGDGGIY